MAGFPSIIDVSKNKTGEIFIYNAGSKIAVLQGITSNDAKLAISPTQGGDSCVAGMSLSAGASCAVKFSISDKGNAFSNITIKYNEVGSTTEQERVVTQNYNA